MVLETQNGRTISTLTYACIPSLFRNPANLAPLAILQLSDLVIRLGRFRRWFRRERNGEIDDVEWLLKNIRVWSAIAPFAFFYNALAGRAHGVIGNEVPGLVIANPTDALLVGNQPDAFKVDRSS